MILVFAGAGASKAVDDQHYPTTADFFARLPETLTLNTLFGELVRFLRQGTNTKHIDIEDVLSALEELHLFFSGLAQGNTIQSWFLRDNRLVSLLKLGAETSQLVGLSSLIATAVATLQSQINELVYELYSSIPSDEGLNSTWVPLLSSLLQLDPELELVTTNYDVVLEQTIDRHDFPIQTGRSRAVNPTLSLNSWKNPRAARGLLTKLHGSVDWSSRRDVVYVGTPLFQGNHQRHVIIYPGSKGRPSRPPFDLFHAHFERVCQQAEVAVFIGYAFRDPFINEVLVRSLPPTTFIISIDPAPDVKPPFDKKRVEHLKQGFDQDSVRLCVASIGRRISRQATRERTSGPANA